MRGAGTADHTACADGTPVAQAVIRRLLSAATGRSWAELAPLRARGWPITPQATPIQDVVAPTGEDAKV